MPELLRTEYIKLDVASRTKSAVIRDMVDFAATTGRVYDPKSLLTSVQEREELCSTALPGGMAMAYANAQGRILYSSFRHTTGYGL